MLDRIGSSRVLGVLDRWSLATWALLAALVVLVLATFRDYGVSWDEPVHVAYGEQLVGYYRSGLADVRYREFENLRLYGGFFDMAQVVVTRPLRRWLGVYDARHLVGGLFGLLGVAAAGALARRLAGPRAGFWAACTLALWPTYYGHIFNNPKDVPFAVLHAWALYACLAVLERFPRLAWGDGLRLGLVLGLALGVRVLGLIVVLDLALGCAVLVPGSLKDAGRSRLPRFALGLGGCLLLALLVMLICWPWAREDPRHIIGTLSQNAQFDWSQWILFGGRFYVPGDLPRSYLPAWLAIQTPLVVASVLLVGLALAARRLFRGAIGRPALVREGLLVAAVVLPVALALIVKPVLYDAARHFLFILPPCAALAGLAIDAALTRIAHAWRRGPALATLLLGASFAAVGVDLARLHPYEYVFFNSLVGGLRGANGRFELDYWAHSFREAATGLASLSHEQQQTGARRLRVLVCGPPQPAMVFLPETFERVRDIEQADYAIVLRRNLCNRPFKQRTPLFSVGRAGVPFTYVYDLRAP